MYERISGDDYNLDYVRTFMPLLDRGFILAFTHKRSTSTRVNKGTAAADFKQLAMDDFVQCVQHLLHEKYTCAAKLAVLVSILCCHIEHSGTK